MNQKTPGKPYALGAILALALVVRVVFAVFIDTTHYSNDSHQYMRVARGILSESPVQGFPNGYPILIALFKLIVPTAGLDVALIGFNILAGVATVWLIYRLGVLVTGSEKIALLCALATAIYPHQIRFTSMIMTEAFWGLLLLVGLLLILRNTPLWKAGGGDKGGEAEEFFLLDHFLAGLTLHVASAVRTSGTLILPALIIAALLFRQSRKAVLVFCLGILVSFLFFFAFEKVGFTRRSTASLNNVLISIASDSRNVQYIQFTPEQKKDAWKTYFQFAVKQPGKFLAQRFWAFWEMWGFWSFQPGNGGFVLRFVVALRFPLFVLSLMALWRHRRNYAVWVLAIPILVLTVIHTMSFSHHRFSVPLEPLMFLLSAITLRELYARWRNQPAPALAL